MIQQMISHFIKAYSNPIFLSVMSVVWQWSPLWLPILLGYIFWEIWKRYTFAWFMANEDAIVLEVILPPEVLKTPLAAELVFTALHQTSGESTFIDRYWLGKRRMWFSVELASVDGTVHFYIWVRNSFFKNIVENAIYAQYPGIEIYEVDDYASKIVADPETNIAWGTEFQLVNKDPYPIKTYVDYGLDREGIKEEEKTDPLTPLLEFLGNCNRGGQVWIQIMLQSHKKDKRKKGTFFETTDWREEAQDIVDNIMKRDPKTKGAGQLSPTGFPILVSLTKSEQFTVEAIQRSISKPAFNVGIRGIYISEKDNFNAINIVGLLSCLKQFNSMELNGFKPVGWHYNFAYPWQDFNFIRSNYYSRKLIEYYKQRAFFHPPYKGKAMILTNEELATLYHFPGTVTLTPNISRTLSKKGEPPANLPL